jgi:RNA polymerase sigma factor (sigma-70 family)
MGRSGGKEAEVCADSPEGRRAGTLSKLNSQELLVRLREGDEQAGSRLFARYLPLLHRLGHRRLPRWTRGALDTADVVQDAVLHTFRRLSSFEPQRDGALLGYLRRTLINRIRDQFRLAARRPSPVPIDGNHPGDGASPLDITIDRETHERYRRALTRLRPGDRDAILARLEHGFSYDQLALILDKPTAEAARLAVRRALVRLAREMQRG